MKKLFVVILLLMALPIFAIGEHGVWNELNGGPSSVSIFIMLFVGGLVAVFFIYGWIESAIAGKLDKDINQFGCSGVILIISIILTLMVKCS